MVTFDTLLAETKDSPPCGPNLEHDLSFFEFEEAARTKPEQRLGDAVKPAEDPSWPKVVSIAQGLLSRTKDLRVAVLLTRALTRTEGIPGLATGLGLDPRPARALLGSGASRARGRCGRRSERSGSTRWPRSRIRKRHRSGDGPTRPARRQSRKLARARPAAGPRRGDRARPAGSTAGCGLRVRRKAARRDPSPRSPRRSASDRTMPDRSARSARASLAIQTLIADRVGADRGHRPKAAGAVAREPRSRLATRRSGPRARPSRTPARSTVKRSGAVGR